MLCMSHANIHKAREKRERERGGGGGEMFDYGTMIYTNSTTFKRLLQQAKSDSPIYSSGNSYVPEHSMPEGMSKPPSIDRCRKE